MCNEEEFKISYWNYRVVSRQYEHGDDIEESYTIHSVYYNGDGSIKAFSTEHTYPSGSTEKELKGDLEKMMDAFKKPTLTMSELLGAVNGQDYDL